jgi:hypothetical protein
MLQHKVISKIPKTFVTKYEHQARQNLADMDTNMQDCSMPLPQLVTKTNIKKLNNFWTWFSTCSQSSPCVLTGFQ